MDGQSTTGKRRLGRAMGLPLLILACLLNLFLMNSETSLLENMVAVELCRQFGKKNVFFLSAEKEIDFIVPDVKLAIQVSYSIKEEATHNREVAPLVKYSKTHEDWTCLLITYDEEGAEEGIPVIPVWKWLMGKYPQDGIQG